MMSLYSKARLQAAREAAEQRERMVDRICDSIIWIGAALCFILGIAVLACASGCTSHKGGKVVDGTNLEIGMTIPGTQWTVNFLSYTGGMKVGANDGARLEVTNEVWETNSYFGVVSTKRHSRTAAAVEPTEQGGAEK